MRRSSLALALVSAIALTGAGCSGCSTLSTVLSPAPIAGKTTIDEKALGIAYSAGTTANILIAHVAPFATPDQAKQLKKLKTDYDAAIAGAESAKGLGDASGYAAKIAAAQKAFDQVNVIAATLKAH